LKNTGYRLVKRKWSKQAFDGEGARRYGGRWNSKGKRCIYLASTPSLALLEIMVHLDDYSLLADYLLYQMEIPHASLFALDSESLADDWDADPAPLSTAQIGDEWLHSHASTALYVPSTIVPMEKIILINPAHQQYPEILKTVTEVDFRADPRL
jgi:RES domain-containing protein